MWSVKDMSPLFLAKFTTNVSNSTPANTFHHLWWLVCSFLGFLSEHLMLPHLHLFCCHSLSFLKEALKVVTWDLTTHGKLLLWASGICGPRVPQPSKISFLISLFKQSSLILLKFDLSLTSQDWGHHFYLGWSGFSLKAISPNILFNLQGKGVLDILAVWFDRAEVMAEEKCRGSFSISYRELVTFLTFLQ